MIIPPERLGFSAIINSYINESSAEPLIELYDKDPILALRAASREDFPSSLEEINERTDREEWYKSIQRELDSLGSHKTWSRVDSLSVGKRAISCK